jgi:dihydrofolate reductase
LGTVIMHNVVSVDGFIADKNDEVGPLHDWYFSGDTPITERGGQQYDHSGTGSGFKVSRASAEYVRSMWEAIGTIVMGRHLFDLVNGWEGRPPAGDHVVVVSHRPKPEGWHPEASCHFADDVATAIRKAQELAGRRTVAVNAGAHRLHRILLGLFPRRDAFPQDRGAPRGGHRGLRLAGSHRHRARRVQMRRRETARARRDRPGDRGILPPFASPP